MSGSENKQEPKPFYFGYKPNMKFNIRQLEKVDLKAIQRGNISELLKFKDEIAYVDIENDDMFDLSPEALNFYKVLQFGLQYFLYTSSHLQDNINTLDSKYNKLTRQEFKYQDILQKQQQKIEQLKRKNKMIDKEVRKKEEILQSLQEQEDSEDSDNLPSPGSMHDLNQAQSNYQQMQVPQYNRQQKKEYNQQMQQQNNQYNSDKDDYQYSQSNNNSSQKKKYQRNQVME